MDKLSCGVLSTVDGVAHNHAAESSILSPATSYIRVNRQQRVITGGHGDPLNGDSPARSPVFPISPGDLYSLGLAPYPGGARG